MIKRWLSSRKNTFFCSQINFTNILIQIQDFWISKYAWSSKTDTMYISPTSTSHFNNSESKKTSSSFVSLPFDCYLLIRTQVELFKLQDKKGKKFWPAWLILAQSSIRSKRHKVKIKVYTHFEPLFLVVTDNHVT